MAANEFAPTGEDMFTYRCKYVQPQAHMFSPMAENLYSIIDIRASHLLSPQEGTFSSAKVIEATTCGVVSQSAQCLELAGGGHAIAVVEDAVEDAEHQFLVVHLTIATEVCRLVEATDAIAHLQEEVLVGGEGDGVEIDVVCRNLLRIGLLTAQSEHWGEGADGCLHRHTFREVPLGCLLKGDEHTFELAEGQCEVVVAKLLDALRTDLVAFSGAHIEQGATLRVFLRTWMNLIGNT